MRPTPLVRATGPSSPSVLVRVALAALLTSGGLAAQTRDPGWLVDGDDLLSVPTGNVGVGTDTPREKLEVAGNLLVDEVLTRGRVVDARAFGADPADDGVDDHPALQAAIRHLEERGGGTLVIPTGVYRLGATLHIGKPVWIRGAGAGGDSAAAASTASGLAVLRWDIQGLPDPMVLVRSETPGNWVHGGGMEGVVLDGFNSARIGVQASSTSGWVFDGEVRRVVETGLRFDGDNGALGTFNRIEDYKFVYGSQPAVQQADGLVLDGVTQTHVRSIRGLYFDGDMIEFRYTDNNVVEKLQGSRHPLGDGVGLRFSPAQPKPARNNFVTYAVGRVVASAGTFGNRIQHLISEGSSVIVEEGAQLHYETEDYQTSGLYRTPAYVLADVREIGTAEFQRLEGDARAGIAARLWSSWDLAPDGGARIGVNVAPPAEYDDGRITRLDVSYTTDAANASAAWGARVRLLVRGSSPGADLSVPDVDVVASFPVQDAPDRQAVASVPLDVPYARGDTIYLSLERVDGVAGRVQVLGAGVHYEGHGPDSPGSGPFDVPPRGS